MTRIRKRVDEEESDEDKVIHPSCLVFSNFDSEEPLRVRPLVGGEVRERGRLWSSCKLSTAVWLEGIKRSRDELWSTVKLGSDVE
jgi:hypothetical protein